MQISTLATLALMAGVAVAKLHNAAVCVNNRRIGSTGNGTPWGLGYGSYKDYEIATEATKCACNMYKNRNTGNNQWDKCPDCKFDGLQCVSGAWHIGGDEMTYYCEKKCGAQGAEAN
ncbi:uncharacterized protein CTRU02_211430 [Colletotrichum truncatum]|uniref:Uncharacterized protein n=1 Tax=Colletotrichum truncatum TaxID=5467 RepID=A0ACC3YRZ2_COLTU|nr:uncharacterized protein CTRU02_02205 [Colletotrichum truncatum]KAF6799334.1 hypothetical protein CTRU02_02205 [Colletotrichum truncatum]